MLSFVHCKPIRINYRPQRSDISSWIIEATVNIWQPACLSYFHRPVSMNSIDTMYHRGFPPWEKKETSGLIFRFTCIINMFHEYVVLYLSNTLYIYIPHIELALTTKINEKILEEEVMHKIYIYIYDEELKDSSCFITSLRSWQTCVIGFQGWNDIAIDNRRDNKFR